MVESMLDAFYALDEVAIGLGAILAIVAAGLLAVQLGTRRDRLAIEVAGEDDVEFDVAVDDSTLTDLQIAIDAPEDADTPTASV